MRYKKKYKSKKSGKQILAERKADCMNCNVSSSLFIVTASNKVYCVDCWDYYGWENLAEKARTTKSGG